MRPILRIAFGGWFLALLWLTLRAGNATESLPWHALGGGSLAGVDSLANVALFLPAGWILSRADVRLRWIVVATAAISTGVEVAQIWIPGRTAILGDVLLNTGGAMLGWRIARPVINESMRRWTAHALVAALLLLHAANHQWTVDPATVRSSQGSEWVAKGDTTPRDCAYFAEPHVVCHSGHATDLPAQTTLVDERGTIATLRWEPEDDDDSRGSGCVRVRYTTLAAPLRLRPPAARYCDLAPLWEITVPLHPLLQRHLVRAGPSRNVFEWRRASVSEFLWSVWPFAAYRPRVLSLAGPMLLVGTLLALGLLPRLRDVLLFLALLASVAGITGLAGPGITDVLFAILMLSIGRLPLLAARDQPPSDLRDGRVRVLE